MENPINSSKKQTSLELEERLIEFASRIIEMVEALPKTPAAKHMGGQILRSGTSPALIMAKRKPLNRPTIFCTK